MYLDYSLRKIGILSGIAFILFSGVYATNAAKMYTFGSTPYFYTIRVGARYLAQSAAAEFAKFGNGMFASAAGALRAPAATASASQKNAPAIPVLTYHRIVEDASDENNVTVERFRDQMEALKDAGWQAVPLADFEAFMRGEKQLPEKSFLLTFDDGAKQSFYPVDPILRELDFHAAIYIIVQSSKTAESTYYLTPEEIRWLLATGRWSIGSHSYDGHRPYGTDPQGNTGIFFADKLWNRDANRVETDGEFTTRVASDLSRSRKELESTFGVTIDTLAFPLGNEAGIVGANNFPEGSSSTETEARKLYSIGFIQTNDQTYTFNFPKRITPTFSPSFATTRDAFTTDFLVHRIHVDYDWDGQRLLSIMENGLAKSLPFEDDFGANRGWIPAWGTLEMGRNNFQLAAAPETTSASALLDGSALWDNYSFDASVNWQSSYLLLLADVLNSKTYHSCAFSPGEVRIQETIDGETHTLAEKKDPSIQYGSVTPGIRVHDSVIECSWGYESLIEDYSRQSSGGIGIQIWDPSLGVANVQVSSIIVRPASTRESTPGGPYTQ